MLFSNDQVARLISEQFEPAWQSVRPVPRVTIDFGNGTIVRRTLHGNVATYVCSPEGHVLDILPGVYEPQSYRRELASIARSYRHLSAGAHERAATWKEYHEAKAARLRRPSASAVEPSSFRGASIFGSERGTRRAVAGDAPLPPNAAAAATTPTTPDLESALAEDTQINQTARRLKIHERLAASGSVTPDEIHKWLYREVLGTDLDDPYLGLKESLFKNYPFAEEEAAQ